MDRGEFLEGEGLPTESRGLCMSANLVYLKTPRGLVEQVISALPEGMKVRRVDDSSNFQPDLVIQGNDVEYNNTFLAPNATAVIIESQKSQETSVDSDKLAEKVNALLKNHQLIRLDPKFSDYGLFTSIEEIAFFKDCEPISPSDIFEFYEGLNPLIHYNRSGRGEYKDFELPNRFQNKFSEWKSGLPRGITALIRTENGKLTPFNVGFRTNFDQQSIAKRPSIVYLTQDNFVLVFREGRVYAEEVVRTQVGSYGPGINRDHYKAMMDGHHADVPMDPNKVLFFPEPYLLASLEQIYSEGGPRITPDLKVVDITERSLFYVRPFLKSVVDLALKPPVAEALATYLGAAQAYGIMEQSWERQMVHYCEQPQTGGSSIVNMDPDLLLNRMNNKGYITSDLGDFVKKLRGVHAISERDVKEFRRQVRDTRERYESDNLRQRLVDGIPPSLQDSILPDLKINPYKPRTR